MFKTTFKTVILGVIIFALALTLIGCDFENGNPGTTSGTTTPKITSGTTSGTPSNTTTTPLVTTGGTTNGTTTGTTSGTGAVTTTRGRANMPGRGNYNRPGNMPGNYGNGALNGADRGGMLFGSAPDYYNGNEAFQNGYTNGLTGNNGYPYGNPTGHFNSGYPNDFHGHEGIEQRSGQVADNGGNLAARGSAPGFFGSFGNTPGVNVYDSDSVMNRIKTNNELCSVADEVRKEVKGMREVRDALVCATEDNIYIGIKPGIFAGDMTALKNEIQDKVRKKFPQVEYVHITDDNINIQSIRRAYAKMKNSNLETRRINELLQPVRDDAAIGGNL